MSHPQLSDPAQAGIGHDPELLNSSAHGYTRALALLYEAHGPAALHLAYRVLGDHTIAEDVTREAFVALGRGKGLGRPPGESVRDWLLAEVRASAIDALRGRARSQAVAAAVPPEGVA